jgi:hypothetical protein
MDDPTGVEDKLSELVDYVIELIDWAEEKCINLYTKYVLADTYKTEDEIEMVEFIKKEVI